MSQQTLPDSVLSSDAPLKDPATAIWLSAALPGAGQVYNESYWKSAIILPAFSYFLIQAIQYDLDLTDLRNAANPDPSAIEVARDNRSLNIWRTVGVYIINLLDAYIGAYLFGFDDLMTAEGKQAYRISPQIRSDRFSVQLSINF